MIRRRAVLGILTYLSTLRFLRSVRHRLMTSRYRSQTGLSTYQPCGFGNSGVGLIGLPLLRISKYNLTALLSVSPISAIC